MAAFAPLGAGARAIGAARFLAALLQRERMEAVRTGRVCGLRFDDDGSAVGFARVVDGNGNGLRSAEIADGIDPMRGAARAARGRIRRRPLRDRRGCAGHRRRADDPGRRCRPGAPRSAILAFAPTGSATSGTLYLASADRRQFAVRVLGPTGRVRIFEFERATARWVPR